jgi:hypothetical protein
VTARRLRAGKSSEKRARRPSRRPAARDMDTTPFARILTELILRLPGAFACALVDLGGETVDYAGVVDPFDVKVAAAHMRIILNDLDEYAALGRPRWVVLRGSKRSFVARTLPDGYGLVVMLRRRAGFTASARAFAACERELATEAGWGQLDQATAWFPVKVEVDRRRRPAKIGSGATSVSVEVLGSVMGLPRNERGFRVRTSTGSELTVVREAGNTWYADEDLMALTPREPAVAPAGGRDSADPQPEKARP